jgi:hypothetical protein
MISDNKAVYDTYFALLEKPELRQLGAVKYEIKHRTPFFSREVYETNLGMAFRDEREAYQHWVEIGRKQGLSWAHGKDTLLKIVLKAKDEVELIDLWVAHHAAIVGYENLIIMDCGSKDPAYLEKLRFYRSRILILDYRRYYDNLHSTRTNADLFRFLADNCKYITILDADEFLFARRGDLFSSQLVKQVLQEHNLKIFCGVWINTVNIGKAINNTAFPMTYAIDIKLGSLQAGAVGGKAIARHDVIFDIGHLGHNLHSPDVFPVLSEKSFGQIFVLHTKHLSSGHMRQRILAHLIAKGAIIAKGAEDIESQIKKLLDDPDTPIIVKGYAQQYLAFGEIRTPPTGAVTMIENLINSRVMRNLPALDAALAKVNFLEIIRQRYDLICGGNRP